ncbi:MAG: transmembrane family protein [Micavibrio aeruginosavorus]|uniref:Transmembrane family protein n=1 Tax=Micavibrio aeruginosavorus TaxID=349221 RepID=A0A2W5FNX1_9BACT|nr:MAG: transmembrane family protein [Micavibrio aeruginosavorus]
MKYLLLFLSIILFPLSAHAQSNGNIVIDLADDHVDITSDFSGEAVTVFGTTDQDGDIAIILRGPQERVVLRKKHPVLGMWLNRESIDFKNVPLFYNYAVSRPENNIADNQMLRTYGIGLNALNFEAVRYEEDTSVNEFQEALVRTQQAKGFFPLTPSPIRFMGQRLFKTSFYLPANVPVGRYTVEGYLFKGGSLVDRSLISLDVGQAGLSASVLNFAAEHSLSYALLGLFLAMVAGFTAFWMSRSQRA